MAKNKGTIYLGYEDEEITAKHTQILNSTTNKVGGFPDWPASDIKVANCSICNAARSLIVQIYAPLEQSQLHRTLYIFACLNPTCSQNSKSWLCVRIQHLDTSSQCGAVINTSVGSKKKKITTAKSQTMPSNISWCNGSDDWGDYEGTAVEEMDTRADSDNQQEENGNLIENNDNSPIRALGATAIDIAGSEEDDDDEDESISMENEIICSLSQLEVHSVQRANDEDPNANCAANIATSVASGGGGGGSAIAGAVATATFCAEIEGDESDLVLVESPKKPERDLIALLKHTPNTAIIGPMAKITDVTLKPFFVAVDIETNQKHFEYENYGCTLSDDHIRELYHEYKRQDETAKSPNGSVGNGVGEEHEVYEKALPAHGDTVFHQFITTIQMNPGQILRYSRDTLPLLNAPLSEAIPRCPNCNGETICELQILPTLIPKLRLQQNNEVAPIEFGNVLVFTCLKSCWDTPDKMRFERIIVQTEN